MSAKATTTKAAGKKATKAAKAKKAPANKREGMSALDAAAKMLGESKEPLNTKTMIERMAAKGYWTSPGGRGPRCTRPSCARSTRPGRTPGS